MRVLRTFLWLLLGMLAGIAWVNVAPKPHKLRFQTPKGWPQPVYAFKNNPLTEEGIALGKSLFYDPQLSADSTLSCADCHQQFAAFTTFEHPVSHGIRNQLTTRNAPALQNLAWQTTFMHDGGINHLDVQFLAPLTAPNEMGANLASVIHRLQTHPQYPLLFKAAFGDTAITTQRIGKAFSQFMLSLVSCNSKYDRVQQGKDTFILPEKLGYQIFRKKCASCHPEPLFTDNSFRNIGMPNNAYNPDAGRMRVTLNPADSLKFKVPSLRNVMVTAPYGHDGRFFSVLNVLEHYRSHLQPIAQTDAQLQHKLPLSNFEIGQLIAFLNTLTDEDFLKNPAFGIRQSTPKTYDHPH